MKNMFIIIAAILILAMLPLALFSCNVTEEPTESSTEAPTEKPTEETPTEKPTDATEETEPSYDDVVLENTTHIFGEAGSADRIKTLGRTAMDAEKGICFDHTATGIEFNAVVEGDITIEILCEAVNDDEAYLAIFVDGRRIPDYYDADQKDENGTELRTWKYAHVKEGVNTITIARDLAKDAHNIKIVKQTEANYSLLSIKSISMKGYLLDRPADNEYYIEFIGDSLTCGMGVAGNSSITAAQGKNGADWEDGTLGQAYLTAQQLGVDYSIVSESGIGLASSWFDDIFDFYTKASFKRDQKTEYDFEGARKPDLVVINLGTNDYYLNSEYPNRGIVGQLKGKTKELINTIRAKYGEDTPILWVSGIWSNVSVDTDVMKQIDAGIKELGGESANIYRLVIDANAQNKMGAENHPSQKGHQQTAKEVVAFIKNNNLIGAGE